MGANRAKKNLPTNRAKYVGDINKTDSMSDVPGSDLLGFGPEGSPIEASPVTELYIDQQGENSQDSAGYQNAFSIHVSGEDPSCCGTEHGTLSKVNEVEAWVNAATCSPRTCGLPSWGYFSAKPGTRQARPVSRSRDAERRFYRG